MGLPRSALLSFGERGGASRANCGQTSAGLSTRHSMSTRRLESWVRVRVTPDAAEGVPGRRVDPIACDTGRRDDDRDQDLVLGHRGLAGRHRAELHGARCGWRSALVVSLDQQPDRRSRPSRWIGSSRPARLRLVDQRHRRPSNSDSVTAWYSQVSRRPSMRCRRSSVARDAASDAIFGRERQARSSCSRRLEQLLGREVEAGELFGREHADREPRRRDGALHEHAVELELHHAAEALDDGDADDGGQHGEGDGGDLRRDPVGGDLSRTAACRGRSPRRGRRPAPPRR